jgi:uncharacterized membrane protein YphA (DoxX/SURF4 family)
MLLQGAPISYILRLFVGILFLFSGLIKLNDPIGFSLTIETYLHGFALDFSSLFLQFLPYSLLLAIGVCILEIILGLALVIKFQTKWIIRGLFILTGFFTLLTLYTLWLKRVDSCGCLSDAIPLAPYQSLLKNILILLILYRINKHSTFIQTKLPLYVNLGILTLAVMFSIYIGWHTYHKLPVIDFGKYPVGTSILSNNGLKDLNPLQTVGSQDKLSNVELPLGFNDLMANSFIVWDEEKEITKELLQGTKLLCIIQGHANLDKQATSEITAFSKKLLAPIKLVWLFPLHIDKENFPVVINGRMAWASTGLLRSMIKADIGFILLQQGVVVGKWSYRDLHKLQKHLNELGFITQN